MPIPQPFHVGEDDLTRNDAREWWRWNFAKSALQGLLAGKPDGKADYFISTAVKLADALIAELDKAT